MYDEHDEEATREEAAEHGAALAEIESENEWPTIYPFGTKMLLTSDDYAPAYRKGDKVVILRWHQDGFYEAAVINYATGVAKITTFNEGDLAKA